MIKELLMNKHRKSHQRKKTRKIKKVKRKKKSRKNNEMLNTLDLILKF